MKKLTLFCVSIIAFMSITSVAYAHYLTYSAVTDTGDEETMYYAVDPSAESIRNRIDNATKGADSWDKLDCYYSSACTGVNWVEVTPEVATSIDNGLLITVEPTSPTLTQYGLYQKRFGPYDYIIIYKNIFDKYGQTKQNDMLLHETGHALGLGHAPCSNSKSVMVTGCFNSVGHPGSHDRTDYKTLWITNNGPGSFPTTSEETDNVNDLDTDS